jgi:hypothetical protein
MSMLPPRMPPREPDRPRHAMVRWNAWNLLLLVPLLGLFTPIYNRVEPRLFGVPFFYWFQLFGLVFVVGVTLLVYRATNETEFEKYAEADDDRDPFMGPPDGPRFPHFPERPDGSVRW